MLKNDKIFSQVPTASDKLTTLQGILQGLIHNSSTEDFLSIKMNNGTFQTPGVHLRITYSGGDPVALAIQNSLNDLGISPQEKSKHTHQLLVISESAISDQSIDEAFKEKFMAVYSTHFTKTQAKFEEAYRQFTDSRKLT